MAGTIFIVRLYTYSSGGAGVSKAPVLALSLWALCAREAGSWGGGGFFVRLLRGVDKVVGVETGIWGLCDVVGFGWGGRCVDSEV